MARLTERDRRDHARHYHFGNMERLAAVSQQSSCKTACKREVSRLRKASRLAIAAIEDRGYTTRRFDDLSSVSTSVDSLYDYHVMGRRKAKKK